jgi:NADH-quinone oxidoreductase subunit L
MPNSILIALIPLLPLCSFLIMGLFGRKYFNKSAGIIGTLLLLSSTVIACLVAYNYFFSFGQVNGVYQSFAALSYNWLTFSEGYSINIGLQIDAISVMMLVVVTFVSLMVHLYSLGYMKGEERFSTYYAFLGLFTFSMLGLVLSTNIFQIYIFWELVGVSSFLLIGFYFNKPSAVAASKKAFIVTRFADLGFLIGILILSNTAHSFDFQTLIQTLTNPNSAEYLSGSQTYFLGASIITWGVGLVFIGGAGKSAMFPLHIWLPDAMEGPTPVSALIHAATMVVAGVYLVARLFPIFALSAPVVLEAVGWVGAVSAIFAAVIACTQTDIKRVLAYSTMSQIGFMMFALGVANLNGEGMLGYTASMFHLFTHALFKALLFLGAGAVIHYVHSNEMKDMGGLRKSMPITHITFLIACLAISGVPPFAGFFSKEEILLAAYHNNSVIYWIAIVTSGLTAFYMFRLYFSIFWNKETATKSHHHGEGGFTMMFPLILLAIGAATAGFIPFGKYVTATGQALESHMDISFSILPVTIGLLGIAVAFILYKKENQKPDQITGRIAGIYKAAYHKFYIDEVYIFITKNILFNLVGKSAAWFDRTIVDGTVNLLGNSTTLVAEKIKQIQSGSVQKYALFFLSAIIILTVIFIYVWKFY